MKDSKLRVLKFYFSSMEKKISCNLKRKVILSRKPENSNIYISIARILKGLLIMSLTFFENDILRLSNESILKYLDV